MRDTQQPASALSSAIAQRIDNQLERAFRHTYGAEAGLRTLVQLGATTMLRAGASPQAVEIALVGRVDHHASHGKTSLVTGESRSVVLRRLVLGWCTEACAGSGEEVTR